MTAPPSTPTTDPDVAYLSGHVLLQPTRQTERREYNCIFMQPGLVRCADNSDSDWRIPPEVIATAAPLFNGVACYLDHSDRFGFGWHQDPKVATLAGVTFSPTWSELDNALAGGIRLYDQPQGSPGHFIGHILDQMLKDLSQGLEVPEVGLSAHFYHRWDCDDEDEDEKSPIRTTAEISHVVSVDFVYAAGAGGYVRNALAALPTAHPFRRVWNLTPQGGNRMPNQTEPLTDSATDATSTSAVPPAAPPAAPAQPDVSAHIAALTQRLDQIGAQVSRLATPPAQEPPAEPEPEPDPLAAVNARIDTLTVQLADQEEGRTIEGMGTAPRASFLYGGLGGLAQIEIAVEAMLNGTRPPANVHALTGIRDLYLLLSGDTSMTGVFNPEAVYLANVTSSTMAGLVANALNKRVINMFMQYPQWWKPAVTEEDFNNLQDVRWITLGGVGELPTVAEGAAYTELTWDDFTETDAFVKKGGYLGITLETIDKDDTRRVTAAPRALAQAAWLTLGKSISAIFTTASGTGPTMSDAVVLFHAVTHSNLLTAPFSYSAYEAVKTAMMKQTEINSGERLGALTRPRFVWVPIDLETAALQVMASEGEPGTADNDINVNAAGNQREQRLARARDHVIVCPLWTDTNNWAAQADPNLYPSIGLGYRYGRTPEIFSVASPTAGLMFSNDTLPVKVRFFFAVGPTDWRGLHKNNVA